MLGDFGLRAALAFEIDRRPLATARVELADAAADDPEPRLEPTVEYGLFIIAREALHNAMKHARAARIAVELALQEDRAELVVRDDGAGFDPADETRARPPRPGRHARARAVDRRAVGDRVRTRRRHARARRLAARRRRAGGGA